MTRAVHTTHLQTMIRAEEKGLKNIKKLQSLSIIKVKYIQVFSKNKC